MVLKRNQIKDESIDNSKVAENAAIQESKIHNLPSDLTSKVSKDGDTMTGFLTLDADPINPLEGATKQYVDSKFSGTSFSAASAVIPTRGFTLSKVNNNTFNISFGVSKDSTQQAIILVTDPIDITLVSPQANTYYYVHLTGKSNAPGDVQVVVSSSGTLNPGDLPSGYDISKLIGCIRTDSSNNIKEFTITGKGSLRKCIFHDAILMSNPVITTANTWTVYSLSDATPIDLTTHLILNASIYNGTANIFYRTAGSSAQLGMLNSYAAASSSRACGGFDGEIYTDGTGNIEIVSSIAGTNIDQFFVKGFYFEI
jgi:hypothetical protein